MMAHSSCVAALANALLPHLRSSSVLSSRCSSSCVASGSSSVVVRVVGSPGLVPTRPVNRSEFPILAQIVTPAYSPLSLSQNVKKEGVEGGRTETVQASTEARSDLRNVPEHPIPISCTSSVRTCSRQTSSSLGSLGLSLVSTGGSDGEV